MLTPDSDPQQHTRYDELVQYGGGLATLYAQPGSTISVDIDPSAPQFIVRAIDRRSGAEHHFLGLPGLGIVDVTASETQPGELVWVALFDKNDPDPHHKGYNIHIADKNEAHEREAWLWKPFEHPIGGFDDQRRSDAFRVMEVAVEGNSAAAGNTTPSPRHMNTPNPFQTFWERIGRSLGGTTTVQEQRQQAGSYPDLSRYIGRQVTG